MAQQIRLGDQAAREGQTGALRSTARSATLEVAAAAVLIGLCIHLGGQVLHNWRGPAYTLSNTLYVPAAMYAAGHGFINPPLEQVPGLRAFLSFEGDARHWKAEALPKTFSQTALDTYQTYHRYLIFAMGLVWRVFGVSWHSAKILVIGVYAATTLAAYALFRNGMGRLLAMLGAAAFAASPLVFDLVYNVRDFSKAPFILLVLALLLFLGKRCRSRWLWFLACAILGLCVGVGLGFRRDLLICPVAVVAVLLVAPRPACGAIRDRAGGIVCFLLVLIMAAAPIVASFRAHGSLVHHDMMMGLATEHDHSLGLRAASYEKLPIKHDLYVTQISDAFHMRANAPRRAAAPRTDAPLISGNPTRAYFWALVRMFPADFLTRSYQAVFRIGQGVDAGAFTPTHAVQWPRPVIDPLVRYLEQYGPWHLLGALLLLAAFRLRTALVVAGLLVYFGGLTSLQYEARHALHMFAAAYGLALLPLGMLTTAPWRDICRRLRAGTLPVRRGLARCSMRVALFAAVAAIVTGVPLAAARVLQHNAVAAYETRIEAAAKEPVPFRADPFDYGLLYRPAASFMAQPGRTLTSDCLPVSAYLMAELEGFAAPMPLWIAYESMGGQTVYDTMLRAWPVAGAPPATVRYYFPIMNFQCGTGWTRFAGIGIAAQYGRRLKGLYRVAAHDIPLHLNITVADDAPTTRAQALSFGMWEPDWERAVATPDNPHSPLQKAHMAIERGDLETARALIDAFPAAHLFPMEALQADADWHAAAEHTTEALRLLTRGMQQWPFDMNLAMNAGRKIADTDADPLAFWRHARDSAPDSVAACFMLGQLYERRSEYARALDAYQCAQERAGGRFQLKPHSARAARLMNAAAAGKNR